MKVDEFVECPYSRLSSLTGISKTVWSYYFNGRRGVSEKTLRLIANKLNMSIADVILGLERRRTKVEEKIDV